MSKINALLIGCATLFATNLPYWQVLYGNTGREDEPVLGINTKIQAALKKSPWPIPFHVESAVNHTNAHVDLYAILGFPINTVKNELRTPPSWCDIFLLSNYVRACTYDETKGSWQLTIYQVNRFYDPLEKAFPMKFDFNGVENDRILQISLNSPKGPFHTQDHSLQFEVIPLSDKKAFIHVSYSFAYSFWDYLAMQTYFDIFLRGKTGFSKIGTNREGQPVYSEGFRGGIERNIVRYFLAILAYMDTTNNSAGERFEMRITHWFNLAALFGEKILNMRKEKYLNDKRQDQKNQLRLQGALGG